MEDKPLYLAQVADVGEAVRTLLNDDVGAYKNTTVTMASDRLTIAEMAEILTENVEDKTFIATTVSTKHHKL